MSATSLQTAFETSKGPERGTCTGVLLQKAGLANAGGRNAELRHSLMVTGADGYAVAVGEFAPRFGNKSVLLAYEGGDGKAGPDHLRLIVPEDLHGGRAVSNVVSIEVR